MKRLFKCKKGKQGGSTRLEDHLIRVAKAWCNGLNKIELKTLEHFYNALQNEKQLYVADHHSARSTSVRILQTPDCVTIGPADPSMPATVTITYLTAEELDELEVQDSLLIPLRT